MTQLQSAIQGIELMKADTHPTYNRLETIPVHSRSIPCTSCMLQALLLKEAAQLAAAAAPNTGGQS